MSVRPRRALMSLVLVVASLSLRDATAWAERLPLRHFTMRDGLPSNTINCLVRDRSGLLWICTNEGLAVYDGFIVRTFGPAEGLASRPVNALLEARDGTYWIATDDGLVRFRPDARGRATPRFDLRRPPAPTHWTPDPVIANRVLSLLEDHTGQIWCGTAQAGLFRVQVTGDDEVRLELARPDLPIDTQVNVLAESPDGTLWVGTQRGLLRRSPGGANEWLGYEQGLSAAPGVVNEEITSLLVWGSSLFVGTRYFGLHRIEWQPHTGRLPAPRDWHTGNVQGGDGVFHLTATSDGHLWFGGPGGPREMLLQSDPVPLRVWGARDGFARSDVSAVAEDEAGDLWFGTHGAGLVRLRRGGFRTFTTADGLAGDQVKDVFTAKGSLHVVTATARGLYLNRFDGGRFTAARAPYYTDPLGWGTNQIALNDSVGGWWFATWNGARRSAAPSFADVDRMPFRRYGLGEGLWSDHVFKVFEDSNHDIWIGSFEKLNNVSRWRRDSGQIERHIVRTFPYGEGFGFGFVPEVFAEAPAGVIWTGSVYGGVARFKDGRWNYFDEQDGVPAGRIQAMVGDGRSRLWIGSASDGLVRIDHPEAERPTFVPIRKADGLSSDAVLALTEDRDGRIYVGTGVGVDRLGPDTMDVRRFGTEDGLPSGPVVAAYRDEQGSLWFGTSEGLAAFRPSELRDPGWPQLRVMSITATDLDVRLSDFAAQTVPPLELQPYQNALAITLGARGSGPMPGLRLEGRLEGSSADWVPIEPGRPVMLLGLPPGRYRFVARAAASGRVGPSTASVPFTILRVWWLRPWALALQGVVLLGLGTAAYQLRVRQLLAIERVRTRIASDLHDDLGASLSRVVLLSEAARGYQGADREVVALGALGEVASTARSLAAQTADIVWATDPRHDTVGNVIGRASSFGSELFEIHGIEWRPVVEAAAAQRRLSPDEKRHLLLLVKEALNNVAKHAGATAVRLDARIVEGGLTIEIVDNGCGFDVAAGTNGGHGLRNIDLRARALGGTCHVASSPGSGCRITLRMP